jgi:hypothetical protein
LVARQAPLLSDPGAIDDVETVAEVADRIS